MKSYANSLLNKIEEMRLSMINLASLYGYTNPSVLQCSQELDELLNKYHLEK
ncbi:aspartyl-phosphate phosphatase Spo0E family protein [Bacillus sp. CGMCC 1.16607]|uniref:aspartyl-phosphate phosphatase Spo0E family protein n=1 Tax=Bacillus sp. CGMCC 1.16607 TaxID=3351842 RepID=UPI003631544F